MAVLKKFFCVLLIFALIFSFSGCNSNDTYSKIENFTPHEFVYSSGVTAYGYYDIGSCRKLVGSVYTLVVFLDDYESSWSDSARSDFYNNRFEPSASYIINEAERRNINLEFNYGQYSTKKDSDKHLVYDGIVANSPNGAINNLDIMSKTAKALGFTNKDVMHGFLQNYAGTSQVAYILVLNKAGRAYAVSDTTYDGVDSMEFVVAFSASEGGNKWVGSSVIHELLHLFGAADLYDTTGQYPDREKLCKKLYPNDIMRKSATNPETLSIGRLTECLIGWSDYFPPECDCPEWWNSAFEEEHRPHSSSDTSSG